MKDYFYDNLSLSGQGSTVTIPPNSGFGQYVSLSFPQQNRYDVLKSAVVTFRVISGISDSTNPNDIYVVKTTNSDAKAYSFIIHTLNTFYLRFDITNILLLDPTLTQLELTLHNLISGTSIVVSRTNVALSVSYFTPFDILNNQRLLTNEIGNSVVYEHDVSTFYSYVTKRLFSNELNASLVYDCYNPDSQEFYFLPRGWKIDLLEKLIDISQDEITLVDERYNRRIFTYVDSDIYLDSTGSGLFISPFTENNEQFYKLYSPIKDSYKVYNSNGYLVQIVAENGRTVNFTYSSTQINIVDAFNRSINISNSGGAISISSSVSSQVYSLTANQYGYLSSISFKAPVTENLTLTDAFIYEIDGYLKTINTSDGYSLYIARLIGAEEIEIKYNNVSLSDYSLTRYYHYILFEDLLKDTTYDYYLDQNLNVILEKETNNRLSSSNISFIESVKSIISSVYDIGESELLSPICVYNSSSNPAVATSNDVNSDHLKINLVAQGLFDSNYDYLLVARINKNVAYSSAVDGNRGLFGYLFKVNPEVDPDVVIEITEIPLSSNNFGDECFIAFLPKTVLLNRKKRILLYIKNNCGSFIVYEAYLIKITRHIPSLTYYQNNDYSQTQFGILSLADEENVETITEKDVLTNELIYSKYGQQNYFFLNNLKDVLVDAQYIANLYIYVKNYNSSGAIPYNLLTFIHHTKGEDGLEIENRIIEDNGSKYRIKTTKHTSFNNLVTTKYYDFHGNILSKTSYTNVTEQYDYGNDGLLILREKTTTYSSKKIIESFNYDNNDRLTQASSYIGNQIATTSSNYLSNLDIVSSETDGENNVTNYGYSLQHEYLNLISKSINSNIDSSNITMDDYGRITFIENNGVQIGFSYSNKNEIEDIFYPQGNTNVNILHIDRQDTTDYGEKITTTLWSNFLIEKCYNKYQRLTQISWDSSLNVVFSYTTNYSDGLLSSIYDTSGQESETTNFSYDDSKRIVTISHLHFLTLEEKFSYSGISKIVSSKTETITGSSIYAFSNTKLIYSYSHDPGDDALTDVSATFKENINTNPTTVFTMSQSLNRDGLHRSTKLLTYCSGLIVGFNNINYFTFDTDKTSFQVQSVSYFNNGGTSTFTYDKNGNVTSIGGTKTDNVEYEYDENNQLILETNLTTSRKIEYSYDRHGNIVSAVTKTLTNILISSDTYSYASTFPNELVSFNGVTITYDSLHNPTSLNGATLTYYRGNKLSTYSKNNTNITFKYNGSGLRTYKLVNTTLHRYVYDSNNRIIREKIEKTISPYGTDTLTFVYGINGIMGFKYNNDVYVYEKDIFNNVIALHKVGASSNPVAKYSYDAYGNTKVLNSNGTENTSSTFIGNINPFRYRSYYFDNETGFYYCQSRYYVPCLRRWLTMDDLSYLDSKSIYGLNLYAYCNNNPIMYSDDGGHFAFSSFAIALLVGIGIGAAIGAGSELVKQLRANNNEWSNINVGSVIGHMILGAAFGAASVFGGAAGVVAIGGSIAGYSLSSACSLLISVGLTSAASMTCYSLGTIKNGKWDAQTMIRFGVQGALQGFATFGISYFGGVHGLYFQRFKTGQSFYYYTKASFNSLCFTSNFLFGEGISRLLFVSMPNGVIRWLIDFLIPDEE
jgi:RHS repeat-associated protein